MLVFKGPRWGKENSCQETAEWSRAPSVAFRTMLRSLHGVKPFHMTRLAAGFNGIPFLGSPRLTTCLSTAVSSVSSSVTTCIADRGLSAASHFLLSAAPGQFRYFCPQKLGFHSHLPVSQRKRCLLQHNLLGCMGLLHKLLVTEPARVSSKFVYQSTPTILSVA